MTILQLFDLIIAFLLENGIVCSVWGLGFHLNLHVFCIVHWYTTALQNSASIKELMVMQQQQQLQ